MLLLVRKMFEHIGIVARGFSPRVRQADGLSLLLQEAVLSHDRSRALGSDHLPYRHEDF